MKCSCIVKKNIEDMSGSYTAYGDGAHRLEKMLSERLEGAEDSKALIDALEDALEEWGFEAEWIDNDGFTETTRWVEKIYAE